MVVVVVGWRHTHYFTRDIYTGQLEQGTNQTCDSHLACDREAKSDAHVSHSRQKPRHFAPPCTTIWYPSPGRGEYERHERRGERPD